MGSTALPPSSRSSHRSFLTVPLTHQTQWCLRAFALVIASAQESSFPRHLHGFMSPIHQIFNQLSLLCQCLSAHFIKNCKLLPVFLYCFIFLRSSGYTLTHLFFLFSIFFTYSFNWIFYILILVLISFLSSIVHRRRWFCLCSVLVW